MSEGKLIGGRALPVEAPPALPAVLRTLLSSALAIASVSAEETQWEPWKLPAGLQRRVRVEIMDARRRIWGTQRRRLP
jgi:hypothetical protein